MRSGAEGAINRSRPSQLPSELPVLDLWGIRPDWGVWGCSLRACRFPHRDAVLAAAEAQQDDPRDDQTESNELAACERLSEEQP